MKDNLELKSILGIKLLGYLQIALLQSSSKNAFQHLIAISEPENLVSLRNQTLSKLFKLLLVSKFDLKEVAQLCIMQKLNKLVELIDDPKCLCFGIMLNEMRNVNAIIREISEKASLDEELQVNQARMVEIQKQSIKIFLNLFKRWITSEEKAKILMFEMPGVEFLFEAFGQNRFRDSDIVFEDEASGPLEEDPLKALLINVYN